MRFKFPSSRARFCASASQEPIGGAEVVTSEGVDGPLLANQQKPFIITDVDEVKKYKKLFSINQAPVWDDNIWKWNDYYQRNQHVTFFTVYI